MAAGPARTSPLPDTGTLRGDVDAYATAVAPTLKGPLGVLLLRTAVSALATPGARSDPGRSQRAGRARNSPVLRERAVQLQEMLDRAAGRREHAPTVEGLLDLVVAPLYFHALFGQPMSPASARSLVDRLLPVVGGNLDSGVREREM